MANYNPDKKIKIEIRQTVNPALDYEIWDIRDKDKSRCISRNASEDDVHFILALSQLDGFRKGNGIMLVRASLLMNRFSYMY